MYEPVLEGLYDIAAGGDVLLRVHVQPGAGRSAVMGRHGDALKIKVGAPPQGGRANAAVVSLLATSLGIPEARVVVESGASSRSKRVRISGVPVAELDRLLELAAAAGNAKGSGGVTRHAP
jgi:uncharacterized protein (TIGR00251 family)